MNFIKFEKSVQPVICKSLFSWFPVPKTIILSYAPLSIRMNWQPSEVTVSFGLKTRSRRVAGKAGLCSILWRCKNLSTDDNVGAVAAGATFSRLSSLLNTCFTVKFALSSNRLFMPAWTNLQHPNKNMDYKCMYCNIYKQLNLNLFCCGLQEILSAGIIQFQ